MVWNYSAAQVRAALERHGIPRPYHVKMEKANPGKLRSAIITFNRAKEVVKVLKLVGSCPDALSWDNGRPAIITLPKGGVQCAPKYTLREASSVFC